MSSQKAIKAAYECYVYDCSKLGYEEALKKLLYPIVLYSQTVIPADLVDDGSDIGTYLNELLCEKMKTGMEFSQFWMKKVGCSILFYL